MSDGVKHARAPEPRRGMPSPRLGEEEEFKRRFRSQFQDRASEALRSELDRITEAAWDAYVHSRKSPRTRKAGPGFAHPDYDLSEDWIDAREAIKSAQTRYEDTSQPPRILLINCSSRRSARGRARRHSRPMDYSAGVAGATPVTCAEGSSLSHR